MSCDRLLRFAMSVLAAVVFAAPYGASAKSAALLVGVAQYGNPANNLAGPANDVNSLNALLIEKAGFAANDIVTLVDTAATAAAIRREISRLYERTRAGDEVLIYFSGHGVSPLATDDGIRHSYLPDSAGGAFVAFDSTLRFGQTGDAKNLLTDLIVGARDLRPSLERLDSDGRNVLVIVDSCYSGSLARTQGDLLAPRLLPFSGEAVSGIRANLAAAPELRVLSDLPANIYRNVTMLSASARGEVALDIPLRALRAFPTVDGKPHGALTDAVLRVLDGSLAADLNGDGTVSFAELHRSVADFVDQRHYGQSPQRLPTVAETAVSAANRPVFGGLRGRSALNIAESLASVAAKRSITLWVPSELAQVAKPLLQIPNVREPGSNQVADLSLAHDGNGIALLSRSQALIQSVPQNSVSSLLPFVKQAAFAASLDAIASAGRRAMLDIEIDPAAYGGNFKVGDLLAVVVRPDKAGWLVLVNVDSEGKVSVLYPEISARNLIETRPLSAGEAHFIPGKEPRNRIVVEPPLGTDYLHAIVFDEMPTNLAALAKLQKLDTLDPSLNRLRDAIDSAKGRMTYARTVLRTFPAKADTAQLSKP